MLVDNLEETVEIKETPIGCLCGIRCSLLFQRADTDSFFSFMPADIVFEIKIKPIEGGDGMDSIGCLFFYHASILA